MSFWVSWGFWVQQFRRVTSIGSLPPKTLRKSRGPPSEPRRAPQNPRREPRRARDPRRALGEPRGGLCPSDGDPPELQNWVTGAFQSFEKLRAHIIGTSRAGTRRPRRTSRGRQGRRGCQGHRGRRGRPSRVRRGRQGCGVKSSQRTLQY